MKVRVFLQALKATKNTIYNVKKVKAYLDSLFDPNIEYDPRVKKWVYGELLIPNKMFKGSRIVNALTNSDKTTVLIVKTSTRKTDPALLKKTDPDWVKRNVEAGNPVYRLVIPKEDSEVTINYKNWIDFLEERLREATEKGQNYNLEALTPNDMPRVIMEWEKANEERDEKYSDKGTQIIKFYTGTEKGGDFEKGFHWVRLITRSALEKEGNIMRNCIGWLHIDDILEGKEFAYSLRDRTNHPWVDLAFMKSNGKIRRDTLKGPANTLVREEHKKYVVDILNSKKDPKITSFARKVSNFKNAITLQNIDKLDYILPEEKENVLKLIKMKSKSSRLIPYSDIEYDVISDMGLLMSNGLYYENYDKLPDDDPHIIYSSDKYRLLKINNDYVFYVKKNGIKIFADVSDNYLFILQKKMSIDVSKCNDIILDIANNKDLRNILKYDSIEDPLDFYFYKENGVYHKISNLDKDHVLYENLDCKLVALEDKLFIVDKKADNTGRLVLENETVVVGWEDLTKNATVFLTDILNKKIHNLKLGYDFNPSCFISINNMYYTYDNIPDKYVVLEDKFRDNMYEQFNFKLVNCNNNNYLFPEKGARPIIITPTGELKYFYGRIVNYMEPSIGRMLVKILNRNIHLNCNDNQLKKFEIYKMGSKYYFDIEINYDDIPDRDVLYQGESVIKDDHKIAVYYKLLKGDDFYALVYKNIDERDQLYRTLDFIEIGKPFNNDACINIVTDLLNKGIIKGVLL